LELGFAHGRKIVQAAPKKETAGPKAGGSISLSCIAS
jgi:hypothetical protein